MTDETLPPEAEKYLRRLGACLGALGANQRGEIVSELRAHFEERRAQGRTSLLEGFESPEAYAARFIEETALSQAVAHGSTFGLGRALVSGARTGSETALIVVPLIVVQWLAVLMFVLGILKPFFFRNVGLFLEDGGSLSLGITRGGEGVDVLGWWTVPAFIVPSAMALFATKRALRAVAVHRLARTRRNQGAY
jgi:hypothetical protein